MGKKCKNGSAEVLIITFTIMTFMAIIAIIYMLYTQINNYIYRVKSDIFYIVQNAYLSLDTDELSLSNYVVDENILKDKISIILYKNYNNEVDIENLHYSKKLNSVNISLIITIDPIAFKNEIGKIKIRLKENVKLRLMEVE